MWVDLAKGKISWLILRSKNSDYDVFLSPLADFKKEVELAGLGDKVVYLDRKDAYRFKVDGGKSPV